MWQDYNAPSEYRLFRYEMGFKVGDVPIPDPAVFTGSESDLDTMGERDANGYLHRNMVATKHPIKIEYKNIPWAMIVKICGLVRDEKIEFTFPDPFTNGKRTIEAYVGDREFECVWAPADKIWLGNLKISFIEY